MCFGTSKERDETVVIKNRIRPLPRDYDERVYVQTPARTRARYVEREPRYVEAEPRYVERDVRVVPRDRSLSRSRRSRDAARYVAYEEPRRSSRTFEERRVSRHYHT